MKRSKLQIIKSVVEDHQYTKISMILGTKRKKLILDAQSAHELLNFFNSVPTENKAKLESLPWHRLLNIIWRDNP